MATRSRITQDQSKPSPAPSGSLLFSFSKVDKHASTSDNLLRYPAVYRIIAPTPVFLHIFSIKRPMQRIALETVARVAHDELQHLIYSSDNPVVAEGGRTFRGGGLQISVSPLITHRRPVRCWDVFVALAGLVEELERYGINEVKVLMFLRTYELAKPEALITVVRL